MQKIFEKILLVKQKYKSQIVFDTRNLKKNDIFIGIKTKNDDGSLYFKDAIEKGAKLIILNNYSVSHKHIIQVKDINKFITKFCQYLLKNYEGKIISITGSVGKTTIKENIYNILIDNNFTVCKSYKNFNNLLGLQFSIMNINENSDFSIFELGINAPGEMSKLINLLNPHFCLVTCIENSHIGNFKNFKHLVNNKIKIFNSKNLIYGLTNFTHSNLKLKKTIQPSIDIINIDKIKYLIKKLKNKYQIELIYKNLKKTIISESNGIYAETALISYIFLSKFINKLNSKTFFFKKSIIDSRGNVLNKIFNGNKIKVFDHSYNASPYSLSKQLSYFHQKNIKKKLCIIGSMKELGDNSDEYHIEIMEKISLLKFDKSIFIGDEFYKIKDKYKNYKYYKSYKNYIKIMNKDFIAFKNIFIMGSRSNQLNKIIEKI